MDEKVIIVDETKDDDKELTEEDLEEIERQQRLSIIKKMERNVPSIVPLIIKVIMILGLFGIMLAMLLQSGVILCVSLIVIFCDAIVNYIFFR